MRYFIDLYNLIYDLEVGVHSLSLQGDIDKRFSKIFSNLNRSYRDLWKSILWKFPLEVALTSVNNLSQRKVNRYIRLLRIALEKSFQSLVRKVNDYKEKTIFDDFPPAFFTNPLRLLKGFKLIKGKNKVLLIVSHNKPPGNDLIVDGIAEKIAEKTNSYLLCSTISRIDIDYNRSLSRISPFRRLIDKLVFSGKVNLIIDLHGFAGEEYADVIIGVRGGISSDRKVVIKLKNILEKYDFRVKIDVSRFYGGDIIAYHSFPPVVNAIQLEINHKVRKRRKMVLVKALTEFIEGYK